MRDLVDSPLDNDRNKKETHGLSIKSQKGLWIVIVSKDTAGTPASGPATRPALTCPARQRPHSNVRNGRQSPEPGASVILWVIGQLCPCGRVALADLNLC